MWEEMNLGGLWENTSLEKVGLVICQISPDLSLDEGIVRVANSEKMLSKFELIIEKINNSKTDNLTLFVFPELCLSKTHIDDLITITMSFERNLILITGIEHLLPEEALAIIDKSVNSPDKRQELLGRLTSLAEREFYINMGLIFVKNENSTNVYYFLKHKPSSAEQQKMTKRFFKGENFWLFNTPRLNFTPFICYDFISRDYGELMIPKLKKELSTRFPNFILTHIIIPTLRDLGEDRSSKFSWNVENYYFVEPKEDILAPLSQFCTVAFSNIARVESISNDHTRYGHSNIFFVSSDYDSTSSVPKYTSIEKITRVTDKPNKENTKNEKKEKEEKNEDRRKLNLIKIELVSDKELYLYLQLKDFFFGDIDRIEDISVLEIIDGRWKEY